MIFSRFLFITFSLCFLASCTFSSSLNDEKTSNSGANELTKTESGIITQKTPSDSGTTVVPAIINKDPISLNTTVIKTPPVQIISNNTISDSEKDECTRKFESPNDRDNCMDTFYMKKAMISKDTGVCAMISNSTLQENCKDNVLLQEVSTKNDTSLCVGIKNPDTAGSCFAIVGKQMQAQNKDIESKITDPCRGITSKDVKLACTESIIFNEAVRLRDTAMCKTLASATKQSMCASLIKSILENGNPLK